MQWGTLSRVVPLLRVLWVWATHRQQHWDYSWDLAAAGTMEKVFSNRKTTDPVGQNSSHASKIHVSTWIDHLQNKIS